MSRFAYVSTLLLVTVSIVALWTGCPPRPASDPMSAMAPPPPPPPVVVDEPPQPPSPKSRPTNRYLIYWPVEGGNYAACLETNSYTIKNNLITFRVDGIREIIRWEEVGMEVTLTPPWGITDTQATKKELPAEAAPKKTE